MSIYLQPLVDFKRRGVDTLVSIFLELIKLTRHRFISYNVCYVILTKLYFILFLFRIFVIPELKIMGNFSNAGKNIIFRQN